MANVKTKSYKVDGETRVGIWVDGVWKHELDCHSQYSIKEAKEDLIDGYNNGYYK